MSRETIRYMPLPHARGDVHRHRDRARLRDLAQRQASTHKHADLAREFSCSDTCPRCLTETSGAYGSRLCARVNQRGFADVSSDLSGAGDYIGDFLCRRFHRFVSIGHRSAAAVITGLLISSWFTYLAGCFSLVQSSHCFGAMRCSLWQQPPCYFGPYGKGRWQSSDACLACLSQRIRTRVFIGKEY